VGSGFALVISVRMPRPRVYANPDFDFVVLADPRVQQVDFVTEGAAS
jgi:hypothetical protein